MPSLPSLLARESTIRPPEGVLSSLLDVTLGKSKLTSDVEEYLYRVLDDYIISPEVRDEIAALLLRLSPVEGTVERIARTLGAPHMGGRVCDRTFARCWHHPARTSEARTALLRVASRSERRDPVSHVVADGPNWQEAGDIDLMWARLEPGGRMRGTETLYHWLDSDIDPDASWSPAFRAAVLVFARRVGEAELRVDTHLSVVMMKVRARRLLLSAIATEGFIDADVLSHLAMSPDSAIRTWAILDLSVAFTPERTEESTEGPVRSFR